MRRVLFPVLALALLSLAPADAATPLWRSDAAGVAARLPYSRYGVFVLDAKLLGSLLDRAPAAEAAASAAVRLELPSPDGRMIAFSIVASRRTPELRTFSGRGVSDPSASVRMDVTALGLHARISSAAGTVVIAPLASAGADRYVSYDPRSVPGPEGRVSEAVNTLPASRPLHASDTLGVSTRSVADATPVIEGNSGNALSSFVITLQPPSGSPVSVRADTADGSATVADNDYLPIVNQTVFFNPGETSQTVSVSIVGDTTIENNETFTVVLSQAVGASIGDGTGVGTIVNDDFAPSGSLGDLVHDSREIVPLPAQSGQPRPRVWTINQEAYHSYEVIVDGVTGDVAAGVMLLQRLASDGTTVLQTAPSASGGSAQSLRFKNSGGSPIGNQFVRVGSGGCGNCGANDTVRVRAYDTTYRVSRYNNSATQITLLLISNTTNQPVQGTATFFSTSGAHLADVPFTLAPRAIFVSNTSTVPGVGGTAGTVLVSNDAPFGALSGKAVAVEPATGFTFDKAMVPRDASTKMVPRDN